ncbi:hypothetical protein A2U01_0106794 [Trifolium medium]|uniref:Uncharacterized protein n=1 Tax=Trifolium medium TaxID=97028 RepID=A0A392VF77_9FABA|nr:hypothetical protein [Trifolium medium]
MQKNDPGMLRKRKEETTITGQVAHKSIETGHLTEVKGRDIATSLITRPADTAIAHIHRKGVIHQKDNTRL